MRKVTVRMRKVTVRISKVTVRIRNSTKKMPYEHWYYLDTRISETVDLLTYINNII